MRFSCVTTARRAVDPARAVAAEKGLSHRSGPLPQGNVHESATQTDPVEPPSPTVKKNTDSDLPLSDQSPTHPNRKLLSFTFPSRPRIYRSDSSNNQSRSGSVSPLDDAGGQFLEGVVRGRDGGWQRRVL